MLWHATGALPVLVATLGPGVANAVNVVANAQQDRVPLVFVTGCVDQALAESYTHQVFDHQAVLRPIVKASFRAAPGTEELVVDKAIAIALSGPARPGAYRPADRRRRGAHRRSAGPRLFRSRKNRSRPISVRPAR